MIDVVRGIVIGVASTLNRHRSRLDAMNVIIQRSAGGHLWHWVPVGSGGIAKCGYKPSSPNGHIIRGRGRWTHQQMGKPTCERCFQEFVKAERST